MAQSKADSTSRRRWMMFRERRSQNPQAPVPAALSEWESSRQLAEVASADRRQEASQSPSSASRWKIVFSELEEEISRTEDEIAQS